MQSRNIWQCSILVEYDKFIVALGMHLIDKRSKTLVVVA